MIIKNMGRYNKPSDTPKPSNNSSPSIDCYKWCAMQNYSKAEANKYASCLKNTQSYCASQIYKTDHPTKATIEKEQAAQNQQDKQIAEKSYAALKTRACASQGLTGNACKKYNPVA